jgi:hypothetical protein
MHKLPAADAPVAVSESEHVTQLRLARELALGDIEWPSANSSFSG